MWLPDIPVVCLSRWKSAENRNVNKLLGVIARKTGMLVFYRLHILSMMFVKKAVETLLLIVKQNWFFRN